MNYDDYTDEIRDYARLCTYGKTAEERKMAREYLRELADEETIRQILGGSND